MKEKEHNVAGSRMNDSVASATRIARELRVMRRHMRLAHISVEEWIEKYASRYAERHPLLQEVPEPTQRG